MSVYMGPLGGLVKTVCLTTLDTSLADPGEVRLDIANRPRVERIGDGRQWRTWSATVDNKAPHVLSTLRTAQAHQSEAWWLVPCGAPIQNVMPPYASWFHDWSTSSGANLYRGGMVPVDAEEGLAPVSATFDYNGPEWRYTSPLIPLPPEGGPVTASVFGRAFESETAAMRLLFTDGAGNQLLFGGTSTTATTTTASGTLPRVVLSVTPPAGAHAARIQLRRFAVAANPALTWTEGAMPWTEGKGAERVVVFAPGENPVLATARASFSSASYTVQEVAG